MITEKRLLAVAPQAATSNGTSNGGITVADTANLKVGQVIILKSSTQQDTSLQIKRVTSSTQLFLGDEKKPIQHRANISAFLTADGTTIEAPEQKRPSVPEQEIERHTYEEEPTIARRVVQVDQYGNKYTTKNPFPVQLSDGDLNIGTVNAELEVQLSHLDNDPDAGDIHDSVRIGDGVEELAINPDGSINVNFSPASPGDFINLFDEVASVASATPTTILTYTVPVDKDAYLIRVEYGGTNIATYNIELNSTVVARRRTWFNGPMSDTFEFDSPNSSGLPLAPGDVVTVVVEHSRPFMGDFETRLQIIEL